jgi:cell division septation protein DedD
MNRADFKGKSGLNIPGKAFMIVIVVFFSSMSFVLGFLVGKNAKQIRPEPVAQIPLSSPNQPAQSLPQQAAMSDAAVPDNAVPPQEAQKVIEKSPSEQTEEKNANAPAKITTIEISEETTKETKETASVSKQQKMEAMYTVQLGAIKNKSEAEILKAKYEKKGYKIYISISNSKNNEKIYKIRVGRFSDRKDAEILALKLKNNDGMNSFVTFAD